MVTKLATLDGIEQLTISPAVNTAVAFVNEKIIKDDTMFLNMVSMYNEEGVSVPDNVYDNPVGGSTVDIITTVSENEELSLKNSTMKPINRIILADRDNKLKIRPLYLSTLINIEFKYRAQSKAKLLNIKNSLLNYYNHSGYTLLLDIPYSYMLPDNVLVLLENIKRLKGIDSLESYLNSIAVFKLDYMSNKKNTYRRPVFRGIQTNRICNINTKPKDIVISREDTEYSLTFEISFSIDKPTGVRIDYPILVNNRSLDDIWIPRTERVKPILNSKNELDISNMYSTIINDTKNYTDALSVIPTYDTFRVPDNGSKHNNIKIMSILLEVEKDDLFTILKIDDLKYVNLPLIIIEALKKNTGNKLFICGQSLFLIELYEFKYIRDLGLYKTDDNIIKTTIPLDPKSTYHILITMLTDLDDINYTSNSVGSLNDDIDLCNKLNIPYTNSRINGVHIIKWLCSRKP